MIIMQGDLFSTDQEAIGHGVNCQGMMGAGIAVQFKERYPEMYEQYKEKCDSGELKPGDVFYYFDENSGKYIFNLASQNYPGKNARLEWLAASAAKALNTAEILDVDYIAIPMIGAGIGGLDPDDVLNTLEQVERNRSSQFVVYQL